MGPRQGAATGQMPMCQEKARQDGVRQAGKIRRFGRKAEYGAERGIGGDETSIEAPPEDAARRLDRGRNTANTANSSVSLRARALGMLARREHSRAELARKLVAYAGSDEALAALLDDLEARRLLSDARYVEARLNARGARYGNRRLSQELRARGVDAALVETALAACGDEVARALQVWQRRFGALPPAQDAAGRAKQVRFLMRRGFSGETIRRVLGADFDEE